MIKQRSLLPALICLIFFLMACSLGQGALSAQEPSTPVPVSPTSSSPAQAAAPTDQPAPAQPPAGDFNLADPAVGLDSLHSYRQVLQTSFEGTINGEPQRSQTALTREVVDEPPTRLTWIETDGQGAQFDGSIGSIQYRQPSPAAACAAFPQESTSPDPGSAYPLASLPPVSGAVLAGEEEVNGLPAKHYTFDERAVGFTSPAKAQGDVWVAASGGVVLRYTLTLESADGQLGPGVSGTQTWSYELSEIDAGKTSLPDGCQPPQENADVPQMDGAIVVVQKPGYLVYQAAGSADEAVAFYQKQAETLGWSAGTPFVFGSLTRLTLRPADGSLVQLAIDSSGDQVTVTVQTLAPLPAE